MGAAPPFIQPKALARILVKRLCVFLLVLSGAALFFWAVGNFRDFLDSTQLILLGVQRFAGFGLTLASVVGLGLFLGFGALEGALERRLRDLSLGIAGYLLLAFIGLALGLLAESLYVLTRGLGGGPG